MFTFSKIFWLVFSPGKLVVVALIVGTALLYTRYWRTGRLFVGAAMVFMVLIGIFPIGYRLTEILENRFPANPPLPAEISGIVVLGGTVMPHLSEARGQPALTDGSERLVEMIHLGRRYPEAKLIFSGGSGSLSQPDLKETVVAKAVLDRLGFDDSRVVYESRSRNTQENAIYALSEANPGPSDVWVLVTSAKHMPRAMGAFRAAGWSRLIAYPVDYSTDGTMSFDLGFGPLNGLDRLDGALREWVGLAAYRFLDRTKTFFPAPSPFPDN